MGENILLVERSVIFVNNRHIGRNYFSRNNKYSSELHSILFTQILKNSLRRNYFLASDKQSRVVKILLSPKGQVCFKFRFIGNKVLNGLICCIKKNFLRFFIAKYSKIGIKFLWLGDHRLRNLRFILLGVF